MQYIKIGDLCNVSSSKRVFARQYVDDGIPFYRQKEVIDKKNGNTIEEPIYISESDYNIFKAKFGVPANGDLLITAVGATLGIPYFVGNEQFYFKDGNLIWLSNFKEKLNSKFLYYWIDSSFGRQTLWNRTIGSAQPALTIDSIKKLSIPVPSKAIQDKISTTLTTFDQIIENNNKRIKLLEQMAENLYKEWFVRFRFPGYENVEFENGIPKGWEVKKIKNCVKRLPFNRLYKRNELESEGKVIVIDQSSAEFLGYHNDEPSHCASIDKPVLLFGDHSCKFMLMIREFSLGENVVPFISENENKLNDYYLFYAVHKIIVTEEYKRHWGRFTGMKILVPDYELQRVFADFIKPIIQEQNNLWNEIQLLIKQRDMLLPRLMSGKLEV